MSKQKKSVLVKKVITQQHSRMKIYCHKNKNHLQTPSSSQLHKCPFSLIPTHTHFSPSTLCYRHRRRVFLPTIKRKKYIYLIAQFLRWTISSLLIFSLHHLATLSLSLSSSTSSSLLFKYKGHHHHEMHTKGMNTQREESRNVRERRRRGKEIHPTYFQWARLVSSSMRNVRKTRKMCKKQGMDKKMQKTWVPSNPHHF